MKVNITVKLFALQELQKDHKEPLSDEEIKTLMDKKIEQLIKDGIAEPVIMLNPQYRG